MNVVPADAPTPKDYATGQEVCWCPGCGDYAILKAVRKTLAGAGSPKENTVFVSGIGCAARLPYYMATYGFHTIHGRAPAIATGIKLANPDLDVWVITGDGDAFSIGGNHFLHVLRRNVNLQILVFNNEVYGLTKGQYSPTSRTGMRTPSTPMGSLDYPVSGAALALGAGARFVARSVDTQQRHLSQVLERAHGNVGASFVEIFQNCIVYNDKVFADFTDRDVADDKQIHVRHGRPPGLRKGWGTWPPAQARRRRTRSGDHRRARRLCSRPVGSRRGQQGPGGHARRPGDAGRPGRSLLRPGPQFRAPGSCPGRGGQMRNSLVHELNDLLRRAPTWTVGAEQD